MRHIFVILFFYTSCLFSQNEGIFHLDSLRPAMRGSSATRGLSPAIKGNWKYHKGDDIKWAASSFNDSQWQNAPSNFGVGKLPPNSFEGIGWFRMHIIVDTSLVNKTLGLLLAQVGASEIYLDGNLLYKFGTIDVENPTNEKHYDPVYLPVDIRFENRKNHLLAVRYANARAVNDFKEDENDSPGFTIKFAQLREAIENRYVNSNVLTGVFIFYFAFFLALSFLHFMLFLYYRKNKSNLYYSIFNFTFGIMFIWLLGQQNLLYPDMVVKLQKMGRYLPNIYAPALLALLYTIFYNKLLKIFWLWLALYFMDFVLSIFNMDFEILYFGTLILFVVESLRIIIASIYKKRDGAWIIGAGVITTLLFFTIYTIISFTSGEINYEGRGWSGLIIGLATILATLSIPISMTVYLARDFSGTNKSLEKKLIEVEELSYKTIEQEKEKQHILANQNTMLEQQVKERTSEIEEQKKIIEEKNKDITDSINYAKRLQLAILPSDTEIKKYLSESFLFYNPKDIVAGDFYWMHTDKDYVFIAAADCTGHGVPGAMVSVVCSNALNRAINEFNLTDTGRILDKTRELVIETFEKSDSEVKDGMDISLLRINYPISQNEKEVKIQWSGANNSVWYILNHELIEVKADKQPIGKYSEAVSFTTNSFSLTVPVSFYLFSDGYADQFSQNDKKLLKKKFKEIILSIQHMTMQEQGKYLEKVHLEWKGTMEQTDDVLVIGIKI